MSNYINILIRTTFRPEYFNKCVNSIFKQSYKNYNIICCYDDKLCLNYLKNYENKINYFYIKNNSKEKYRYNLYCNELLKKVNKGYIMFLDDDDMFTSKYALEKINEKLKNDNHIVFWKFKCNDKIIFPNNMKIKVGYVANSSYCFHHKFKDSSKWEALQIGDFNFLDNLLKKNTFDRIFIEEILTGTIWLSTDKTKYGNEGKKIIETNFKEFFYEYYIKELPTINFDENFYKNYYEDLKLQKKNFDFYHHWNKYGKKELRSCSKEYQEKFNEIYIIALEKFNNLNN